jgi:phosphatase NudJ
MRFKPSVTVAAVIEHKGKFLLVQEHTPEGKRLNQPAGHLEQSESPMQACVREVREETARDFTPAAFLGVYLGRFKKPLPPAMQAPHEMAITANTGDISLSIAHINSGYTNDTHEDITYVRLAFSGSVGEEIAGLAYDKEIIRTLWMSADEIRAVPEQHRSPMVMLCIDDYLAGRCLPLEVVRTHESVWSTT